MSIYFSYGSHSGLNTESGGTYKVECFKAQSHCCWTGARPSVGLPNAGSGVWVLESLSPPPSVGMCSVWPSHPNDWPCRARNESTLTFGLSSNIPVWKLFGWFRWPQLWATGDCQLHRDNVPHRASGVRWGFFVLFCFVFLKHWMTEVTQPHYSSELVPCYLRRFPKVKLPIKGKRFQTCDEIQENRMEELMATGRSVWGLKVPTLKGTEASLS